MIFQVPDISVGEQELIEKILEIQKSLRSAIQTPKRWSGFLRRSLAARAIQGSNSIEGYDVSFDEAVAVIEGEEIEAREDTRHALEGYRQAMTYIVCLADDQFVTLNEELIRSLHYMMLSYNSDKYPGKWRPGPIYVRRDPSGEIVYDGPDADQVPGLMRELVGSIQNPEDPAPVIVRAAMAHLNLVMIHPFSDGNGRMGRALQTFVLAREGILHPAFSSVEEYLGSRGNTEAYYSVLAKVGDGSWHPERTARHWVQFCLKAHLQQAVTVQRRAKETAKLWDELENALKQHGLDERMIVAIYEASIGLTVRAGRYRSLADVSTQVASRDLRSLVREGFLVPHGEKRGRKYVASTELLMMREKVREPRVKIEDLFGGQLSLPL